KKIIEHHLDISSITWHNIGMEEKFYGGKPPAIIGKDDAFITSIEDVISTPKKAVEIEGGDNKYVVPNPASFIRVYVTSKSADLASGRN
ncbi:MAG: hypothetical protein V1771_05225, partial [Chloroflexota bacterium]